MPKKYNVPEIFLTSAYEYVGTYTKVYVYAQLQNANVKRIYVCR